MNELYKYIISAIIGIPIGILGSFFAWLIVVRLKVGDIKFSPIIKKNIDELDNSGFKYHIKLIKRAIYDLELITQYKVKGLHKNNPDDWNIIYIPIHLNRLSESIPTGKQPLRYRIRLYINDLDDLNKIIYPKEIIEKAKLKTILLEDLLNLGTDRTLQIFAFGIDEFTGIRKFFKSKIYSLNDIKKGSFEVRDLDLVPTNTGIWK